MSDGMDRNRVMLHLRVSESGRAKIMAVAEQEKRSMSDMTRLLLVEALDARDRRGKITAGDGHGFVAQIQNGARCQRCEATRGEHR
jgi:hypothetical protein